MSEKHHDLCATRITTMGIPGLGGVPRPCNCYLFESPLTAQDFEYRLLVKVRKDLPGGHQAGEEFEPRSPSRHRSDLLPTVAWWNQQGHEAVIQMRSIQTIYGAWKAEKS